MAGGYDLGITAEAFFHDACVLADLGGVSAEQGATLLREHGGDMHAAQHVLLHNSVPDVWLPPVRTASMELSEFGGLPLSEARRYMSECGGALSLAKEQILRDLDQRAIRGDCPICLGEFEGDAILLSSCPHALCRSCMNTYTTTALSEGETHLVCPVPECRQHYNHRELRQLMGNERFQVLDRRALELAVATDPSLHLCSTPDCSFVVSWCGLEDGPPRVRCPRCEVERCLLCKTSPFHHGQGCDEAAKAVSAPALNAHAEEERATRAYMETSDVRICPQCNCGVVKSFGCDKVGG